MSDPSRTFRLAAAAVVVAGGLIVASCSSGSVNTTPIAQATNAPATSQSVPSGGGSLTLPAAANGQIASVTFGPGATAGTTLTASSSTTAPGSAPAPSSIERSTESISGAVPFFFVTFSVNQALSTTYVTGETVALLSTFPAGASFYVEFDDITSTPGTKLGCAGPATVAGLLATYLNGNAGGVCSNSGASPTLQPGHTYLMQFYYVASGSASPSPSPTATSTSGTQAAFPCGSAPPSSTTGTLTNFTTGTPIAYPTLGACSATITFQGSTTFGNPTTINVTTSIALPSGAPTALPTNSNGAAPKAALLYETLAVTAGSITVMTGPTAAPAQTVTVASTGSCSTYGESFGTAAQGWQGADNSFTLNGLTVTFPAGQSTNQTVLSNGNTYYIGYFCY